MNVAAPSRVASLEVFDAHTDIAPAAAARLAESLTRVATRRGLVRLD